MLRIKKPFIIRLISLLILSLFLPGNIAYSSSQKGSNNTLRVPIGMYRGQLISQVEYFSDIKTRDKMLEEIREIKPEEIKITLYDYENTEGASEVYDDLESGLYELERNPFLNDKEFVVQEKGQVVEVLCLDPSQMGSTEYNTWTLGAGRIVKQPIVSLDEQFISGEISKNKALNSYLESAKKQGYAHLLGILQEAGVHASARHLYFIIKYLKENGIEKFVFDLGSDGRDEGPNDCLTRIRQLRRAFEYFGITDYVINVRGREICFDRAKNWDLTEAWINEFLWGSRISRRESIRRAAPIVEADTELLSLEATELGLTRRNEEGKSNFPLDILVDDPKLFTSARKFKVPIYSEQDDTVYVWDADSLESTLQMQYDQGRNDEVMVSIVTINEDGTPSFRLHKGGALFDFNVRKERQKQFVSAIVDPDFDEFEVAPEVRNIKITGMTQYVPSLSEDNVVLKDIEVKNGLAEVLNREDIHMIYVFDSEKGKFIPSFRGGRTEPFGNEDLKFDSISMPVLMDLEQIQSFNPDVYSQLDEGKYIAWFYGRVPKGLRQIPNKEYRKYPGLSMFVLARTTVKEIENAQPGTFGLTNLDGPDLIGHVAAKNVEKITELFVEKEDGSFEIKNGNGWDSTLECLRIADKSIDMILRAGEKKEGVVIIVGDHGSVDDMTQPNHSFNDVPIFIVDFKNRDVKLVKARNGAKDTQADIAVTVLHILEIDKPAEMTGKSLLPDDYIGSRDRVVWQVILDGFGHTDLDDSKNAFGVAMKRNIIPTIKGLYDEGNLVILKATGMYAGLRGGRQEDFTKIEPSVFLSSNVATTRNNL